MATPSAKVVASDNHLGAKGKESSDHEAENETSEDGATIKVAVRCRPLLPHELSDKTVAHCIAMDGANGTVFVQYDALSAVEHRQNGYGGAGSSGNGKGFQFDNVFADNATDAHVYGSVVAPLVKQVTRGFDATLFAYGQVGSGKTHSICGILPPVGRDLLAHVQQRNSALATTHPTSTSTPRLCLHAAYFELYNETIVDLMACLLYTSPSPRDRG